MSEDQLQAKCFQWHWNTFPNQRGQLFMVNNTPRNKIDGARLKAMGMVAGVSDMIYIGSNGVVFIEFKTDKGRQTPEQKAFQAQCEHFGYEYHVVRSFDTFKTLIEF